MWVKLANGSLEWITGFSVSERGKSLMGRLSNASQIVLHIYETEKGAQDALRGITELVSGVSPAIIEIEAAPLVEAAEEESEE